MKKIPTLFVREFTDHRVVNITDTVTPGLEEVLTNPVRYRATVKFDGACCAIIGGDLYKRYDAKRGKTPPAGAIPCQPKPDAVTGHWPHWILVDFDNPADRWFGVAYHNTIRPGEHLPDGTYEAIGPHFQSNPYGMDRDELVPHGTLRVDVPRTFDGIREYLESAPMEGLVFWDNWSNEPVCKIKRTDFGFPWPEEEDDINGNRDRNP